MAIATLKRWLDVLRVGGILFMAIPDKRYTFDRDRPLTEVDHVLRDYFEGPGWSRDQHFEEYCRFVQHPSEEDLPANIARLKKDDIRIHFHVWTAETFRELLDRCRDSLDLHFRIELIRPVTNEFIVILRKVSGH